MLLHTFFATRASVLVMVIIIIRIALEKGKNPQQHSMLNEWTNRKPISQSCVGTEVCERSLCLLKFPVCEIRQVTITPSRKPIPSHPYAQPFPDEKKPLEKKILYKMKTPPSFPIRAIKPFLSESQEERSANSLATREPLVHQCGRKNLMDSPIRLTRKQLFGRGHGSVQQHRQKALNSISGT